MDLIWILLVYLVPMIVIIQTQTVGSVSMCQNETYTSTNYQLSRVPDEPANCTCLLKSTEVNNSTKVFFNVTFSNGCRYKLAVYVKGKSSFLSCTSTGTIFEEITSDIIKLNLEPNNGNGDDTSFILNIWTLPETDLTLSCFLPKIIEPSTTPFISSTTKSTTSTSSEPGISNRQTDRTETSESEQSTTFTRDAELNPTVTVFTSVPEDLSSNSTVYYTQNTVSPGDTSMYSSSTIFETEANTTNNLTAVPLDAASEHKYISEIVGGVIGCLVLVVFIILIVCVIKGRRRKDQERKENGMSCTDLNGDLKMSERSSNNNCFNGTPNPAMSIRPNDVYVNVDSIQPPTFNTFNRRTPEIEIIENDLYVSSDSFPKDNSLDNRCPKMEIIENDLYVSSDSIPKDNSLNNHCAKMEIIENDLYVSSDSITKENTLDNHCPKMEIIENDLYVSSDSVRKDNTLDNRCPKMEIIENDLYVSSDSVRKDNTLDNRFPKMEIIENDLYVSSDSVPKDNSLDYNNVKPEIIENDLYVSSESVRKAKSLNSHNAKKANSVRENYPLDNGQSEPSSGNFTKHDPGDVNLADDNPKRAFVIKDDDCSVTSDQISEEDPNPSNESEQSKTSPHYYVVCPNCVAEEYEEYMA